MWSFPYFVNLGRSLEARAVNSRWALQGVAAVVKSSCVRSLTAELELERMLV